MATHKVGKKSEVVVACGLKNQGNLQVTAIWEKTTCKNCLRKRPE